MVSSIRTMADACLFVFGSLQGWGAVLMKVSRSGRPDRQGSKCKLSRAQGRCAMSLWCIFGCRFARTGRYGMS